VSQAAARAYEDLRSAIIRGVHPAGTRLGETRLAQTLGLSRTPVRDALRRLEADGLVTLTPNRGAEVVRWSAEDFEEIFDVRGVLESHAARRAAERDRADVPRLRALCEEMESRLGRLDEQGYDEITRLNLEFHRAVHHAGGDRLLPDLLARVIEVPLVRRTFHQYTRPELERSFLQHRELVEAIAARDGDWAHAVMRAHVRAARHALFRVVAEPGTPGEPKEEEGP
jgi:DNA-binding GntR family transcriptional regulator